MTLDASHILVRVVELKARLGVVVEHQNSPFLIALMAIFTACRSVRFPKLAVVNILMTSGAGTGRVNIAALLGFGIFHMALVAFGFEMSSDQGV